MASVGMILFFLEVSMKIFLKRKRVLEEIARRNMTEASFSAKIGMLPSHFSRIKSPEKYGLGVSAKVRRNMCRVLLCEFDDIFYIKK
jgi:DNA-binding Xre family transcriptional regulator